METARKHGILLSKDLWQIKVGRPAPSRPICRLSMRPRKKVPQSSSSLKSFPQQTQCLIGLDKLLLFAADAATSDDAIARVIAITL